MLQRLIVCTLMLIVIASPPSFAQIDNRTNTPSTSPERVVESTPTSQFLPTHEPSNTPITSMPFASPSAMPSSESPSSTLQPSSESPSGTLQPSSESPTTPQPSHEPTGAPQADASIRPNVLMFIVDDLKPMANSLGSPYLPPDATPNMDWIIQSGTAFMNAHNQMSICGPSRASFLTSRRPDDLQIYELRPNVLGRAVQQSKLRGNKELLTLPGMFKQAGYQTYGLGKIFHEAEIVLQSSLDIWTEPVFGWQRLGGKSPAFTSPYRGAWVDFPDVRDEYFPDGQLASKAVELLERFTVESNSATAAGRVIAPWFMACGHWKPHLPWQAPKRYWDRLSAFDYPPAYALTRSLGMSQREWDLAKGRGCGEVHDYTGAPRTLGSGSSTVDQLKNANQAYHATVLFVDAQIGKVLNTLRKSPFADNTIIILMSDHGFHLGDHGLYCKKTVFEQATKSPLAIVPSLTFIKTRGIPKGTRSYAPVEYIDVMPTLRELADLPMVDFNRYVEWRGLSLVRIMRDPVNGYVKAMAASQYFRGVGSGQVWGRSVRTTRYRYTAWCGGPRGARCRYHQVYDYLNDPLEQVDLSKQQSQSKLVNSLITQAYFGWNSAQADGKAPFDFQERFVMSKAEPQVVT